MTHQRTRYSTALAAAACLAIGSAPAIADHHAPQDTVSVEVMSASGEDAGTVVFEQMRHGVVVAAKLRNLDAGTHGFHLHETGACSPDFKAAGGHYNPIDAEHGFDGKDGYHVGDLPNVHIAADGTGNAEFFVPQVTLRAKARNTYPFTLDDADGSAVMIHAQADDYADMSSAGGRMACGVIFEAG